MGKPTDLPAFDNPPVIEVVCGVLFRPIESLLAPHLGTLWDRYRDDYPLCQEAPPLAPVIERFGEAPTLQLEFGDKPPLPRIWFVHRNETGIIQVQRDRFLHNWKKVRPTDEYPHYETVIELFRNHLKVFEQFLADTSLGELVPEQYEMTYVNHIPVPDGLNSVAQIGSVFPDFNWRPSATRFLTQPENVNWKTVFALPDRAGRLHVTIRTGLRREDSHPILLFELTARGIQSKRTRDAQWPWFDIAHEWIVRSFADLTGESMHKDIWKRTR